MQLLQTYQPSLGWVKRLADGTLVGREPASSEYFGPFPVDTAVVDCDVQVGLPEGEMPTRLRKALQAAWNGFEVDHADNLPVTVVLRGQRNAVRGFVALVFESFTTDRDGLPEVQRPRGVHLRVHVVGWKAEPRDMVDGDDLDALLAHGAATLAADVFEHFRRATPRGWVLSSSIQGRSAHGARSSKGRKRLPDRLFESFEPYVYGAIAPSGVRQSRSIEIRELENWLE